MACGGSVTACRFVGSLDEGALLKLRSAPISATRWAGGHSLGSNLDNTGLRISELCALELSDVDLRERKGTVKIRQGKGSKQRVSPINKAARKALTAWLDQRPDSEAAAVFIGKRLEPLQPRGVQRMLAEFGWRADVEVTPHPLRHTFAKRMVDSGVPLDQVATLMGHSSPDTTRIYTTPSGADLAKAVAHVDE